MYCLPAIRCYKHMGDGVSHANINLFSYFVPKLFEILDNLKENISHGCIMYAYIIRKEYIGN